MYSYGVVIRLFTVLSFDAQHDCAIRADVPWSAFILLTDHAKAAIYGSGCAVFGLQVDWDLLTGLFDGTDTRPFTRGVAFENQLLLCSFAAKRQCSSHGLILV